MTRDPQVQFHEQRARQIGAITLKHSDQPLPRGMKAVEMSKNLEKVWTKGFETGLAEIEDQTRINVNKQRKTQVGEAVQALGLETEVEIEIFVQVWTAGLLTARDMCGISTPTMPEQRSLTRVEVNDG